ncbi:hypothetical protein EPUS_01643 [Endocarpon pusillum Z07020]|uniref:Uncharacterized protein n=1 Tax=Endocarpon pusillum (strain Z07020 / HMAS-L-300199) TaxID=1263415 RepID=U1GTR7_ENDPU|nr:uncharacterized protein EPUS_01643 [Endocarpon pusillum Z07020]ERF75813.1 hypothetical protein EPUS_01643 [Endocarpon pusillum Z07020]
MALKKWQSWTSVSRWIFSWWRVPQLTADTLAGKSGATSDQLIEYECTGYQDQSDDDSQGREFLTPSSHSLSIVSTPSRSPSLHFGWEKATKLEAFSSDETLHARGQSSPSSLKGHVSVFPEAATSSIGQPLGNRSIQTVDPRHDREKVQQRRRLLQSQRLIDKRMAVLGVRLRVRESRNALRSIREDLMETDARLSQDLRMLTARSGNVKLEALLSQIEGIQNQREEMQLRESEYNILEDELNRAEWEMKEDETKLYEQMTDVDDHLSLEDSDHHFNEEALDAASSDTASTPPYRSPLEEQWLSRIGDRNLALEQLQELRAERARWVEEERVLHRVGRKLDEEAQHFLDRFDSRHVSLKGDLVQIEADLARLQENLSEQADVLYSSSQFDEESETIDRPSTEPLLNMAITDDTDPASKDPLFLREDRHHPIFSDAAIDSNQDSISTVSYINEWLLHILRRSAIEVRRFKMTEKIRTLPLEREQLARLVLDWWSKDETVRLFPQGGKDAGRSVSPTSKGNWEEGTLRATRSDSVSLRRRTCPVSKENWEKYRIRATRSDSVLLSVDRIARRLQATHTLQLDAATGMTVFPGLNIMEDSYRATASTRPR